MNWARDNVVLTDADLQSVFQYGPRETSVIRMLARKSWKAEICSLESGEEWSNWVEKDLPSVNGSDSGLVLLLAKRGGEPPLREIKKTEWTSLDDWLKRACEKPQPIPGIRRANTFAHLEEKTDKAEATPSPLVTSQRRGVRTVPFSQKTFELIASSFQIHSSIARVISRTDVPIFSCEKITMHRPAYIYNCRSSNAWDMDLALTATHFPKKRLTFAILFGCSFDIEKEIITRLSYITSEAANPLLIPGIFAELERARHVRLVDEMVNRVEGKLFELDFQSTDLVGPQGAEAERRSREKREAYLDLAYFQNSLVSWNTQLEKMARHSQQLIGEDYQDEFYVYRQSWRDHISRRSLTRKRSDPELLRPGLTRPMVSCNPAALDEGRDCASLGRNFQVIRNEEIPNRLTEEMRLVGRRITSRLMSIMDEYDDRIRDCATRIDGMAMATQWAQGETNVEIALATNRDSRHMRSIALVTMIFLPGTFFASMFSMTFFNWSNDPGTSVVSSYLWIYVLMTVLCTALTLGLWYYIVILRPKGRGG
ncbi:hypothetical protein K469DRAFT_380510 [Zopfia rhizophila CBS 207.26]|uniref:Cora-domain-containing protein n=1 Tax=Zopfia rhizophila CBS 207.26 TaxID=1314779 RepID=A0A6A6DDT1_9PEZI|nr:hypothetical protein K469DRAFT_380510 [Zopfia rhizophila CBS 207.26]